MAALEVSSKNTNGCERICDGVEKTKESEFKNFGFHLSESILYNNNVVVTIERFFYVRGRQYRATIYRSFFKAHTFTNVLVFDFPHISPGERKVL